MESNTLYQKFHLGLGYRLMDQKHYQQMSSLQVYPFSQFQQPRMRFQVHPVRNMFANLD